jgi:hypothetical protein
VSTTENLGQEWCNIDDNKLGALQHIVVLEQGVGDEHLFEHRVVDVLERRAAEQAMRDARKDMRSTTILEHRRSTTDGTAGIDHVVDDEAHLAGNITDQVHGFDNTGTGALLDDERQAAGTSGLLELLGTRNASSIGRDDGHLSADIEVELEAQVLDTHRKLDVAKDVIDRTRSHALDLAAMEVHGDDARDARGLEEVHNERCRDRHTTFALAVLTSVREQRNDGGDFRSTRSSKRPQHKRHARMSCNK